MNDITREFSFLADDSYLPPTGKAVILDGVKYRIFDSVDCPSGYQATAYQRVDDGHIYIANRGTEFGREPSRDGTKADGGMVRDNINRQYSDAQAFTKRVIEKATLDAETHGRAFDISTVTATGHSLGGTLTEMQAHEFGLHGETFNAYGAASLHYRGLEGRVHNIPQGGHRVINHVRATDLVSSASPHFGEERIYATPEDIAALRAGRYLDMPPDPAHPANPWLTFTIAAHRMDNFKSLNDILGDSIISPQGEKLYLENKAAIDRYRHDVMSSRIDLHDALEYGRRSPQGQRLEAKFDDALDVTRYRLATGLANHVLVEPIEHHLDQTSRALHVYGDAINLNADHMEYSTRAAGQTVEVSAEQLARGAHAIGQISQHSADVVSREALSMGRWSPGLTAVVVSQAQRIGHDLHASAQAISEGAHWAGQLVNGGADTAAQAIHVNANGVHDLTESASLKTQQLGQSIHNISQRLRSTQGHDAIVDKVHQVEHAAREMRGRVGNTLEHAYDTLTQPASWFAESGKEPSPTSATPVIKASTMRPFSDPSHPEHALYNNLKIRLPDLSDERLAQVTGECHKRGFEAGFEGYTVANQEQIVVRDTDRVAMSYVQVFTNQPAPSVQQTMQHVQACDQQQVQDMAQFQTRQAQMNQQQGSAMAGPSPGGPGF